MAGEDAHESSLGRELSRPSVLLPLAVLGLITSLGLISADPCEFDPYFRRLIPFGVSVILAAGASLAIVRARTQSTIVRTLAAIAGGLVWGVLGLLLLVLVDVASCPSS
jgi:hypothetical protein